MSGASNASRRAFPLWALAANVLGVLAALALIWVPEVSLYWVGPAQVSNDNVSQAKATPAREILAALVWGLRRKL
jgi:hypothetical protein